MSQAAESRHQSTTTNHAHLFRTKPNRLINPNNKPDEDYTSSSGSDSESEAEEVEETTNTTTSDSPKPEEEPDTPPIAPHMLPKPANKDELQNRLTSFFSQLAEQRANPDQITTDIIEEDSSDSGYEDLEDENGKQYVELDLALGVLSEDPDGAENRGIKVPGREDSESAEDDNGEEDDEENESVLDALTAVSHHQTVAGSKLKQKKEKRKIEEVG